MNKGIIFLIFPSVLFFLSISNIFSITLDDCENNSSSNVGECIDLFSNKINELNEEKKTLTSQIDQFDTQTKLTQLKITEASNTLAQLEQEIGVLGFRIGYITQGIDRLEILVKKRIVATYQQSFVSDLELILSSSNFSDLILRLQYLKEVQEHDKKILANLQQTKSNYANQKDEREDKQDAIEIAKLQLVDLKASLETQKIEKQVFLDITNNDETRYQRLIAQAQAELAITFGGGVESFMREVKQGDTIGNVIVGDSGCSTGTHLHIEVHKNGSVEDPNNYLNSSMSYSYLGGNEAGAGSISPNGPLPWPLLSPVIITQGYGWTPYALGGSYRDSNGVDHPHFGIDMTKGISSAASVKALKDGKLYSGSYGCSDGTLIYAKIKHDDSLETLYLHMIPN